EAGVNKLVYAGFRAIWPLLLEKADAMLCRRVGFPVYGADPDPEAEDAPACGGASSAPAVH
ncbi:hypothetical protein, partial [Bifidobacterium scardovii]|uniref:hypothetical protein n=1 Tax=Bifidobacterium scardovii TaxID=158787 RepID=UPI0019552F7C